MDVLFEQKMYAGGGWCTLWLKETDNWGTDNLSAAIVAKNRYGRKEKQQKL